MKVTDITKNSILPVHLNSSFLAKATIGVLCSKVQLNSYVKEEFLASLLSSQQLTILNANGDLKINCF